MHTPDSSSYNRRFPAPAMHHQHSYSPSNNRVCRPGYYSSGYELDRPPGHSRKSPNFVIQLRSGNWRINRYALNALIEKLPFAPRNSFVFSQGLLSGSLMYDQWSETLEVVVELWKMRLSGSHSFTPWVKRNVEVPSDEDELRDRVKMVFLEELKRLLTEGELLRKWEKKLELLHHEISGLSKLLKNRNNLRVCNEFLHKREGLEKESYLIRKRIEEFKRGIECIIRHLEETDFEEEEEVSRVLKIGTEFDWSKIHCLMMRECRRLDDGLPIFAFRQQILRQIHYQQVTVLIGETGSGKSTQLVQFLADYGVTGNGSIVCTQPRKIAANSLAQRVKQESEGCYEDTSIICYPSYSSGHKFDSKVVFMTDHCLLQHLVDKTLSKISCIIVDEAHERSLNTDLLLALIKNLLLQRLDLRLVIMSATAMQPNLRITSLAAGRTFPVDIEYVPCQSAGCLGVGPISSYVYDVVKMVTKIHETEGERDNSSFLDFSN